MFIDRLLLFKQGRQLKDVYVDQAKFSHTVKAAEPLTVPILSQTQEMAEPHRA